MHLLPAYHSSTYLWRNVLAVGRRLGRGDPALSFEERHVQSILGVTHVRGQAAAQRRLRIRGGGLRVRG